MPMKSFFFSTEAEVRVGTLGSFSNDVGDVKDYAW